MNYTDIPWDMQPKHNCEYCGADYRVKDVRKMGRLCGSCLPLKPFIDRVRGLRSYSKLTEEDRERIAEKARTIRTVAQGPFFNPKDQGVNGAVQTEYSERFNK